MTEKQVTAGIIITGNEVLSGRTKDENLSYIAKKLGGLGIKIVEARIIADVEAHIIKTVLEYSKTFDYVFTTGGIGPTHDDITAACIAKAFNTKLEENAEVLQLLEDRWGKVVAGDNRKIMAMAPVGAKLIYNPISGAPGFILENVYVMAGIPEIMRAMLDGVLASLRHGAPILAKTVRCFLGESVIADGLAEIQNNHPEIEIGSYPFWNHGSFGASIVMRGTNNQEIIKVVQEVSDLIIKLGGKPTIED